MKRLAISMAVLSLAACTDTIFQVPNQDAGAREDTGVIRLDSGVGPDAGFADAGPGIDTGIDAGIENDAGFQDTGVVDSGMDAGIVDTGPCAFSTLGPADRDRIMIVGHNQVGPDIRSLTLQSDGTIVDNGTRLGITERFGRAEFVPSGDFLLVLTEEGTLHSVEVSSVSSMQIVDSVMLSSASYGDLRLSEDGRHAWVVGMNSTEEGGLSVIDIACDGSLTVDTGGFRPYRLSRTLSVDATGQYAVFFGGGVDFFDPMDANDTRILSRAGGRWNEVQAFDLFNDSVDMMRMALSPDGRTLLVPNGSPFSSLGGTLTVVSVDLPGASLNVVDTLTGFDDALEAIFSPDGQTALVSQFSPNRVKVLQNPGTGWQVVDEITGIGLAEQMAMVSRGSLAGRVYLPSLDASGPLNIAVLAITGPGAVSDLGQFDLGAGSANAPQGIAITP